VQQPCNALPHKALVPAPYAILAPAGATGYLDRAEPGGGQQNDPRPPDILLRAVPVRDDRLQAGTIGGAHVDDDILAHSPRLAPEGVRWESASEPEGGIASDSGHYRIANGGPDSNPNGHLVAPPALGANATMPPLRTSFNRVNPYIIANACGFWFARRLENHPVRVLER
jgi:hypothetical protein